MRRAWLILMLAVTGVAGAESLAIVGGTVHTVGPQGVVEKATILIRDGRIAAVGAEIDVPEGTTVIDAAGKIITPGLFSPAGQLGLGEVDLSADPVDSAQKGSDLTAGFDVADAFNSRSVQIAINRIEGITTAATLPKASIPWSATSSTSHVLSGLGAIVRLGDNDPVVRRSAALVVNLGETGSKLAGGSRAGALLTLRQALDEARLYQSDPEGYKRDEFVFARRDLDALAKVIDRDTPLFVGIDRASDIEALLRLIGEYGVRAIVFGGAEAWMLADELAAADVAVIVEPSTNLPRSFDHINARLGSAGILVAAGVKVSFAEDLIHTHNARNITQAAGNAVADGLAWQDALRAITLTPAELFGVADELGSIETGKRADIVIWPDDPLELTTYPDQVIIDGEVVPMVSRQTLLRDRYLQSDSGKPPAFRDRK